MVLRRASAVLAAVLAAGAAGCVSVAAAAPADPGTVQARRVVADPLLWATVNVCDTVGHPDGIGIRGSMPGSGDRQDQLFMRIRIQFLRAADTRWVAVGRSGDSGFIPLGRGDVRARQVGHTFTIAPPAARRPAFLLRGLVTFEWRRDGVVLRRARRATQSGRPGTAGSDPPGFSAATCAIR